MLNINACNHLTVLKQIRSKIYLRINYPANYTLTESYMQKQDLVFNNLQG